MVEKVEYWFKRWKVGDIPWHSTTIHPCLEQHYQKLIPSLEQPSKTKVFVPLCGKSSDMMWLADNDFQVVGLEGVENVVEAFFKENHMPFEVKTIPRTPDVKCYSGTEKDITIYNMDLFDVKTAEAVGGGFDAIWDIGSMVAIGIYTENRGKRYADLLASLLQPHGRIIVESYVYKEDPGPHRENPSHVPPEMMSELFGGKFKIEPLDVEKVLTSYIEVSHIRDACYNLMSLK